MTLHGDETLVRYLLGETTDEERDALEDDYFADEALTRRLEEVETGLIDAYVRGELPESRCAAFEQRYLGTENGRARAEMARVLVDHREGAVQKRRRPWIYPLAAIAASAVIATGVFFAMRRPAPLSEASRSAPLENTAPTRAPLILKIRSSETRSPGETSSFVVPPGTETVYLDATMSVPITGAPLSALVATPEGTVIHRGGDVSRVPNDATSLRTTVPGRLLKPGHYILTIASSGEPSQIIGEFAFRVVNR